MKKYFVIILLMFLAGCANAETSTAETSSNTSEVKISSSISEEEAIFSQISAQARFERVDDEEFVQLTIQHNLEYGMEMTLSDIEAFMKDANGNWKNLSEGRSMIAMSASLAPNEEYEFTVSAGDYSGIPAGTECKVVIPLVYSIGKFDKTVYFTK